MSKVGWLERLISISGLAVGWFPMDSPRRGEDVEYNLHLPYAFNRHPRAKVGFMRMVLHARNPVVDLCYACAFACACGDGSSVTIEEPRLKLATVSNSSSSLAFHHPGCLPSPTPSEEWREDILFGLRSYMY